MAAPPLPTLAETKKRFEDEVIPERTAAAGFSGNRLWKTPKAVFTGQAADANGLCGDAAIFVVEEHYSRYKDYGTSDGYMIGMILWDGSVLNHIANVALLRRKVSKETYIYDSSKREVKAVGGKGQYDTASLFGLRVFDLYYKKSQDVKAWWTDRDSGFSGQITIGIQHDFA